MSQSIRTFFRHCPSCGRRFEIRIVGKKEIDSTSIVEEEKSASPSGRFVDDGYNPLPVTLEDENPVMVDIEEFRYTYVCKHCGHQWSEVHETERKFEKPEGYTGD